MIYGGTVKCTLHVHISQLLSVLSDACQLLADWWLRFFLYLTDCTSYCFLDHGKVAADMVTSRDSSTKYFLATAWKQRTWYLGHLCSAPSVLPTHEVHDSEVLAVHICTEEEKQAGLSFVVCQILPAKNAARSVLGGKIPAEASDIKQAFPKSLQFILMLCSQKRTIWWMTKLPALVHGMQTGGVSRSP